MAQSATKSLPEACYRAEAFLQPVARRFSTMQEVRDYVMDLTSSDWWIESFPAAFVSIEVETRSSSARWSLALKDGTTIAIANNPRHRTLAVILHELAHVATVSADGHGPIFRSAMIKLVRREMGVYAAVELEQEYRKAMS